MTGLGNRRYFDTQITARLDRRDSVTKGIVLLIKLNDLDKLNQQKGFQAGDELLKRVATLLQEATRQYASCVLARLTGGDFGIFLPDAPLMGRGDNRRRRGQSAEPACRGAARGDGQRRPRGGRDLRSTTTLGRLLSEADLALTAARQTGPNAWSVRAITEETDKTPLGQQQWKEMLEKALQGAQNQPRCPAGREDDRQEPSPPSGDFLPDHPGGRKIPERRRIYAPGRAPEAGFHPSTASFSKR